MMCDTGCLSHGDGSLLNLYCMVHATDTEGTKVSLLTLGLTVCTDDLSDSEFCHKSILLAVKYFTHRNTAKAGNCVSVTHFGKCSDGSLHKVVRV